ncbi:Protein FAM81B [Pteropus alecto]|uniref:Protein FAM81B n=1 Tax=Pteropus alecto TaxID=9402 RepID=L5KLS5_PTEAL|nr:Protein FAM81B [Pteropus alecto]
MKVLSISKASSVYWQCGELHVGPKPTAMTSQKVRVFGSSASIRDAIGSGLSIICLKCSAYMDLTRGHSFLPGIPNTQRNQLEDRLSSQERTIAFLLEQAFRIKEDISACLQGTHGFRKEESLARRLLENHIQTITSIVKKLSQNIEILEDQIRVRDQAATGTNFAVQELNTKHLHGVGDLRGRVARCDSSIMKLSEDIHFIRHEHQQIEKTIKELVSALEIVSKNLDMKEKSEHKMEEKLLQLSSKLENFINTQKQTIELSKVKHIENKLSKKMNQLEKQIWDELEKMQNEYQSGFKSIHDSLSSLQQIQKTKMDLEKYKVQKDLKKLQRKIVELQEV